eukprot:TRINITY_DN23175_c0_g1_i1.p2 TRINITY_DN23175_c0_g1~~TRINITY_DN23175_c0_g1_i1.p2  ORF type:complete len:354 (-),score=58.77 TRINITY_DN23175_c0_g1_i1:583-1644(-)
MPRAREAPGGQVALSVYELPGSSLLNSLTELGGLGGAYHVAVEVYWLEWSYGYAPEGSGISACPIGASSFGSLKERVPLGASRHSAPEVLELLADLRATWLGEDYDLLEQNCAHFAVAFVKRLGVDAAPRWVYSLADVGQRLAQALGADGARAAADAATPAERYPAPLTPLHEEDDLGDDYEWSLAAAERRWQEAQAYVLKLHRQFRRGACPFEELLVDVACSGGVPQGRATEDLECMVDWLIGDREFRALCREAAIAAFGDAAALGRERTRGGDIDVEFVSLTRCVGAFLRIRLRLWNAAPSAAPGSAGVPASGSLCGAACGTCCAPPPCASSTSGSLRPGRAASRPRRAGT